MQATIHKLRFWKKWRFGYYLLCREGTNDILERRYSWLWRKVTCEVCRTIGKHN